MSHMDYFYRAVFVNLQVDSTHSHPLYASRQDILLHRSKSSKFETTG